MYSLQTEHEYFSFFEHKVVVHLYPLIASKFTAMTEMGKKIHE